MPRFRTSLLLGFGVAIGFLCVDRAASASAPFIADLHKHVLLTSSIPANGDENPYALIVAPVTSGRVKAGDVLFDNFNNRKNFQGTGTTIMQYDPTTRATRLFANVPADLKACPGGVGLTTAMTMLKSGDIVVGSMPSKDGTTATLGQGCLIVLDSNGKIISTITDPQINGPWGNIAVIDQGDTATLFISNIGFGMGAPGTPDQHKATVLRLVLNTQAGQAPTIASSTVIASGFSAIADASAFAVGPTGQALGADGTLYVSDGLANRIVAIKDAATRTTSAGTGVVVTTGGLLKRPLAMAMAPNGDLLAINALNGQVVEIDPQTGTQRGAQWIDADEAQSPPGSGDLVGIAMMPDGTGFYYVQDDTNTLMAASR
jgi:sugar lactone lactonase YvrE